MLPKKVTRILRLSKQRAKEGHLSTLHQFFEMVTLRLFYGIGPEYYHTAKLWRRNLTWQFKKSHLGSSEYRHRLDKINPPAYRKISQNKLSEKGLLALFGIPSTRYLGYFCKNIGCASSGEPLQNTLQLEAYLRRMTVDKVCFKPTEGWAGLGFSAVELIDSYDSLLVKDLSSEMTMPLTSFVDSSISFGADQGWIIEEYFQQHSLLQSFNSSSLNTLRVWVTRETLGSGEVVGAFLRLGRKGAVVDNQVERRIVANVALDSGRLSAATDGTAELCQYVNHPDSGVRIEGQFIPHWDKVKELCKRTLKIFPETHFAGMDIAVGADYPVVVELNVDPDKVGAAFMDISSGQCLQLQLRV